MKLDFRKWLKENATTTASVATFARPIFSEPVTILFPNKKKKRK